MFSFLGRKCKSPTTTSSVCFVDSNKLSENGNFGINFPNGDELIIVNILEFLNSSPLDIISCANVCSDWRKVCESALIDLQFSNRMYSRNIFGKIYRPIEKPEHCHFFNYFSSIKITLPNSGESSAIVQKVLGSGKCEKLGLRNFKINFNDIYKRNLKAPNVKYIELGKCEIDSLECFDNIFPNLKHFKFSGKIQKPSMKSFSQTTFTKLESINMEVQSEEQFSSLICPTHQCANMKDFQLYSRLKKRGDFQSKLNREFFPNLKTLFFSMHSNYNEKLLLNCDMEVETLRVRARVSSVALSNLSSLVHLEVKTISSLENLQLPLLKKLVLDSNYNSNTHTIKLPCMHLPNLESLTISDRKGSLELDNFIQFSKLKKLNIDCDEITSLQTIRELKELEDISLGGQLKEEEISHLAHFKITKLRLFSRTISDEQYFIVSQLESLKHLEITAGSTEHFRILSNGKLSNLTYLKFYKTRGNMDYQKFQYLAQSNMKNLLQIKFHSLDEQSAQDLISKNPFPKLRILKIRRSFNFRKTKHLDLIRTLLLSSPTNTSIHEIHVKFEGDYTNSWEIKQINEKTTILFFIQASK